MAVCGLLGTHNEASLSAEVVPDIRILANSLPTLLYGVVLQGAVRVYRGINLCHCGAHASKQTTTYCAKDEFLHGALSLLSGEFGLNRYAACRFNP
jgi:hypothetical protein